jgi:uncharacterized Zn-binding protein involved in type VI secretion
MPPAARLGDMHACPMQTPTPGGPVPHVGMPIIPPCAVTVLICMQPAARVGDMGVCTAPVPNDPIVKGSSSVFICNMPAARIGDSTAHGGTVTAGAPTVNIGG